MMIKRTFTLAEVLIVIGVIGVVSAITIPSLINNISKKAKTAQTDVIEARLLDGINRYSATEDGLSQKHASTYDFLKGLSAYYKMSQICKTDEIRNCLPYDKIYSSDGKNSVEVSSLKTINKFISIDVADNYLAPASFISAQGTPFIMALKKNCTWDMGQAMRSVEDSGCIAYMYDKNGASLPNRIGDTNTNNNSDIITHGITVGGFPLAILGGVKIMTDAFVTPLTKAECEADKSKYGINECYYDTDYWAGAMKECQDKGYRLPTDDELTNIAKELYNDDSLTYDGKFGLTLDTSKIPSTLTEFSKVGSSFSEFWSASENGSEYAHVRIFHATYSFWDNTGDRESRNRAFCVAD